MRDCKSCVTYEPKLDMCYRGRDINKNEECDLYEGVRLELTLHEKIAHECMELGDLLIKKNTDYGNSFEKTLDKYGDVALALRLEDKLNRLETLLKRDKLVKDESFEDTVRDMAGYCLLYLAIKK